METSARTSIIDAQQAANVAALIPLDPLTLAMTYFNLVYGLQQALNQVTEENPNPIPVVLYQSVQNGVITINKSEDGAPFTAIMFIDTLSAVATHPVSGEIIYNLSGFTEHMYNDLVAVLNS